MKNFGNPTFSSSDENKIIERSVMESSQKTELDIPKDLLYRLQRGATNISESKNNSRLGVYEDLINRLKEGSWKKEFDYNDEDPHYPDGEVHALFEKGASPDQESSYYVLSFNGSAFRIPEGIFPRIIIDKDHTYKVETY